MHGLIALLVVSALLGACKKDTGKPGPAPAPKAPASTAEVDALWALAPEGTIMGAVAAPRALRLVEDALTELTKLSQTVPELAALKQRLDAVIQDALGTTVPTLAAAGMGPAKGAALFTTASGGSVIVLPVTDRARFLAVVKGTPGTDSDVVGGVSCKPIRGVYACASPPALFATLGTGNIADARALDGARGDVEIAGVLPGGITLATVAQLEPGAFVLRGAFRGMPPEVKAMVANAKPRTDGDHTAGFGVMNLGPALANVPAVPLAPGVTLDALARSLAGPLTITIAAGASTFDIRAPLSDVAPARALVEQCAQVPALQRYGATVKDGACKLELSQLRMKLEGWVDGQQLRIADRTAPPPATVVPMSALGQELASGAWALAMFGRGTMFGPVPFPSGSSTTAAPTTIRMMALLNEVGFAVRIDGDALRFVAGARTAWANPDDVVAKLLAIDPATILDGGAVAAGKAIADAAPGSPFAGDYAAGYGGLLLSTGALGLVASIAVPGFMDYAKKSRAAASD